MEENNIYTDLYTKPMQRDTSIPTPGQLSSKTCATSIPYG